MTKKKVLTDAMVKKRLKKIQKKRIKVNKKMAKKGQLTAESLELYLGVIDEPYTQLRSELDSERAVIIQRLRSARVERLGRAENLLTALASSALRVNQSLEAAQVQAAKLDLPSGEIPHEAKVSIEKLQERLDRLDNEKNVEKSENGR